MYITYVVLFNQEIYKNNANKYLNTNAPSKKSI